MEDISARGSSTLRGSLSRSLRAHLSASVALHPVGFRVFPVEAVSAGHPAGETVNYEKHRDRAIDQAAAVLLEKRLDLLARRRLPFLLYGRPAFTFIVEIPPGIVAGAPGYASAITNAAIRIEDQDHLLLLYSSQQCSRP